MNKYVLVGAGAFVSGVGVGTLVSALVIKRKIQSDMDQRLDDMIAKYERMAKRPEKYSEYVDRYVKKENEEAPVEETKTGESVGLSKGARTSPDNDTDYTKFFKKESSPEPEVVFDATEESDENRFSLVGINDFWSDEDVEKDSFLYFEGDDILATESCDSVIENRETVIGIDALKNFGYDSDDEDVVCVIDEKTNNAYMITRMHCAYSAYINGEVDA